MNLPDFELVNHWKPFFKLTKNADHLAEVFIQDGTQRYWRQNDDNPSQEHWEEAKSRNLINPDQVVNRAQAGFWRLYEGDDVESQTEMKIGFNELINLKERLLFSIELHIP